MLKIRLTRTGKKRQPHYRVIVADIRSKRDGRVVERIGNYNPRTDPLEYNIKEDRALYWLSVGAQPTDAVRRLLEKQGTYERFSRFRAGETLDALVAEYQGVPLEAEAAEESIVEEAAEEAAEAAEGVEGIIEAVVETAQEVASDVVEAAQEVVENIIPSNETEADTAEAVSDTEE